MDTCINLIRHWAQGLTIKYALPMTRVLTGTFVLGTESALGGRTWETGRGGASASAVGGRRGGFAGSGSQACSSRVKCDVGPVPGGHRDLEKTCCCRMLGGPARLIFGAALAFLRWPSRGSITCTLDGLMTPPSGLCPWTGSRCRESGRKVPSKGWGGPRSLPLPVDVSAPGVLSVTSKVLEPEGQKQLPAGPCWPSEAEKRFED